MAAAQRGRFAACYAHPLARRVRLMRQLYGAARRVNGQCSRTPQSSIWRDHPGVSLDKPTAKRAPQRPLCSISYPSHRNTPHKRIAALLGMSSWAGVVQVVDTDALSGGRISQSAVYFFCGHAFDEDACARHPDSGAFVCSICQTDPRKQHMRRTAPAREVRRPPATRV